MSEKEAIKFIQDDLDETADHVKNCVGLSDNSINEWNLKITAYNLAIQALKNEARRKKLIEKKKRNLKVNQEQYPNALFPVLKEHIKLLEECEESEVEG